MGFIKGTPDPEGSPNEKFHYPPLPRETEHRILSDLRLEGVDHQLAQQLARAMAKQEQRVTFQQEDIKNTLEYWANRHTHPGGTEEDLGYPPFDPEREYILTYRSSYPDVNTIYVYNSSGVLLDSHDLTTPLLGIAGGASPNYMPYLVDETGKISSLDIDTGTLTEEISLTVTATSPNLITSGMVWTPGGKLLVWVCSLSGPPTFYRVNTETWVVEEEFEASSDALRTNSPVFKNDDEFFYTTDNANSTANAGQLMAIDFSLGEEVRKLYSVDTFNLKTTFEEGSFLHTQRVSGVYELHKIDASTGDSIAEDGFPYTGVPRNWSEVPRIKRLAASSQALDPTTGTFETLGQSVGNFPAVNPSNTRMYGIAGDTLRCVDVDTYDSIWESSHSSSNTSDVTVGTRPEE